MRLRMLSATLVAILGLTACDVAVSVTGSNPADAAPTAVSCQDAPQLRQRALDDRRRAETLKSDQAKVLTRNRASYMATLAIAADLKCKVSVAAGDAALTTALEAARKAEESRSFYEKAMFWSEADFEATEAVALLVQQVPAPPSKTSQ